MAASDDLQRIELQVLHRAHGLLGALDAAPAPPWPQTLLGEDEAAGCVDIDGQHDDLLPRTCLHLKLIRVRLHIAPAIHSGGGETQAAKDGGDVGAMLDAVVDDLDEEAAGLVVESVAVFLLMDDVVGRDALDGVEEGGTHIAGEGGEAGHGGLVSSLERGVGAGARQPAHVVCFRPEDVKQGEADGAVGTGRSGVELILAQILTGLQYLMIGPVVVADELDEDGFGLVFHAVNLL